MYIILHLLNIISFTHMNNFSQNRRNNFELNYHINTQGIRNFFDTVYIKAFIYIQAAETKSCHKLS